MAAPREEEGPMDADPAYVEVDVFEQAMQLSGLEVSANASGDELLKLGNSQWAMFVSSMLQNAGISVELLNAADMIGAEKLFEAAQIIEVPTLEAALSNEMPMDEIQFAPMHEMRGLQVKLVPAGHWKVCVQTERKAQYKTSARGGTSRSTASEAPHSWTSNLAYEIVVNNDGVLHTTLAVAKMVTITLLFEMDKNRRTKCTPNGLPSMQSRRVDICFANEFLNSCQVCASQGVPRTVL
jgi:hypothetical protein